MSHAASATERESIGPAYCPTFSKRWNGFVLDHRQDCPSFLQPCSTHQRQDRQPTGSILCALLCSALLCPSSLFFSSASLLLPVLRQHHLRLPRLLPGLTCCRSDPKPEAGSRVAGFDEGSVNAHCSHLFLSSRSRRVCMFPIRLPRVRPQEDKD